MASNNKTPGLWLGDKQLKIEYVPISSLIQHPDNPRAWDEESRRQVTESLNRFGFVDPLVVNKINKKILGGNFRYDIAKKQGYTELPVVYVEITDPEKERELLIRLNKNQAKFDWSALAEFSEEILKDIGFDSEELDTIFPNRGINVKRGLKNKAELGIRPGLAPLGYYNELSHDRNKGKIVIDPIRAPIVKEVFERVAYSGDSGRDILNWLNTEAGFTTRTGKRVALSNVYVMLRNNFYYGMFEYPFKSGNWYEGTHEPMINKELFDKVQNQLLTAPKSKPGTKEFSFTKIFTCGVCGSGVTAEEKFKNLKDGTMRRYIYYHCTGGSDRSCDQLYIREDEILSQLMDIIDKLEIDQLGIKDRVYKELFRYQTLVKSVLGQPGMPTIELPQVDTKAYAKHILKDGSRDEKRELLSCLKTKLLIKDKKVYAE